MQWIAIDPNFPMYVLYINETTFLRDGVCSTHNGHLWDNQNPHATKIKAGQKSFVVGVWTGSYLLQFRLDR